MRPEAEQPEEKPAIPEVPSLPELVPDKPARQPPKTVQVSDEGLTFWIVPHSHTDPGTAWRIRLSIG